LTTEKLPDSDLHVATVDTAITSRMSTRAFTQQPVPQQTLHDILQVASRRRRAPTPSPGKSMC